MGLKQLTASAKEKPCLYDFTSSDGVRHQVWRIDENSDIGKISQIFAGIPHLYIADGHPPGRLCRKGRIEKKGPWIRAFPAWGLDGEVACYLIKIVCLFGVCLIE